MPRLIDMQRIDNVNLREFFTNVRYSSYKKCWEYDIDTVYPYTAHAHAQTILESDTTFFIDLRRFIERTAYGDAVYSYHSMDYSYCWNKETASSWDQKWDRITHGYWSFYFECNEDLVMWRLKKPALMTDTLSRYLPDHDWHTESNTRNW